MRQIAAGQLGNAQPHGIGHHDTVIRQDAGRMGA
jgi:hypothetical protein